MAGLRWREALRAAAEVVTRPYGQIVLSRSLGTGVLMLLAIATFPRLAGATLVAVLVAALVTDVAGLGREAMREGIIGCTAVLTTLATAVYAPTGASWALVVVGAVIAVCFYASFQHVLARVPLPAHSLPFVAAAWTVLLMARSLPPPAAGQSLLEPWAGVPSFVAEAPWLDVPAAVLFLHGGAVGLFVLLAIGWHSRIALLLAGVGAGAAALMRILFRPGLPWSDTELTAAFNALLTAMALGGVWFVPHPASVLLAAAGGALTVALTYALSPVAASWALPLLSLPFVLTVHLVLTAARARVTDRWPSAALPAERPEEALAAHLIRVRRFGDAAWLPFRLPFRGTWLVTQGHDGAHTHQGPWRYAFDFEVAGADGRTSERDGREARDYRCYGLPVLAAGAGTVCEVNDAVPDNRPGDLNTRENWGNLVVIAHGAQLWSVYAHLQPRSLRVKRGDVVVAGTEIGRCGNSGRSAVPHLHFQVQRGGAIGSPTVPVEFGDVVVNDSGSDTLLQRAIPPERSMVRPVSRDEAVADALRFAAGSAWELRDRDAGRRETLTVGVDLPGRRLFESAHGRLYFEPYDAGLVMLACDADSESMLPVVLFALARVPFDANATLAWTDRVPRRLLLGPWSRTLLDLVSLAAPGLADIGVAYLARRSESALTIEGRSPRFVTSAVVSLSGAPHVIEYAAGGRTTRIEMAPAPPAPKGQDA